MLKRVLVSLLLELARTFGASINVTRDTPDNGVKTAYRKVMLKVHPDKPGGSAAAAKRLNNAWDSWNEANRVCGGLGCGLQGPGVGRDGPGGLFKNSAV